jgi:hypothetical protein
MWTNTYVCRYKTLEYFLLGFLSNVCNAFEVEWPGVNVMIIRFGDFCWYIYREKNWSFSFKKMIWSQFWNFISVFESKTPILFAYIFVAKKFNNHNIGPDVPTYMIGFPTVGLFRRIPSTFFMLRSIARTKKFIWHVNLDKLRNPLLSRLRKIVVFIN